MKKLISVLLVAVMMLSVFTLTVAADEQPVHTYSIAKDADGNPLNGYIAEEVSHNKAWTFENNELYLAAGCDQGYLVFTNKANYVEVGMAAPAAKGERISDKMCNGLVFALTDADKDWAWWEGADVHYYWLLIDEGNVLRLVEVGQLAPAAGWKDLVPSEERIDLDDAKNIDTTKGFKIAAEWDKDGNIKAYLNGELVYEIKDETPLTGELYGLRMKQRYGVPEATDHLKIASGAYFTSIVAGKPAKVETGDTTVIVSLLALVAAMGTGIVIAKKRRFN